MINEKFSNKYKSFINRSNGDKMSFCSNGLLAENWSTGLGIWSELIACDWSLVLVLSLILVLVSVFTLVFVFDSFLLNKSFFNYKKLLI